MAVTPILSLTLETRSPAALCANRNASERQGKRQAQAAPLISAQHPHGHVVDERVFQSKQFLWTHKVGEPRDQKVLVLCILGPSSGSRDVAQFRWCGGSLANFIYPSDSEHIKSEAQSTCV